MIRIACPHLHHFAGIHDRQVYAEIEGRRQIIGDHDVGQLQALLQALQ
jgi:hypothetical protein